MNNERAKELVEALREFAKRGETYSIEAGQAADEIERLRAALAQARSGLGMMMLPSHSLQMHQEKLISAINEVLK